jgi:hypothetical protein
VERVERESGVLMELVMIKSVLMGLVQLASVQWEVPSVELLVVPWGELWEVPWEVPLDEPWEVP